MKGKFSTIVSVLATLCLGLLVVNVTLDSALSVAAQQCTCPPMNVGGNTSLTWPAGATVKVFFDDNVGPDRRAIYEQALNNWSQGNNQGVTFTTEVSTGMAQYSMYIKDAVPNGNNSQRGQVVYQTWDSTGGLTGVDIQMNPNVTDPTALLNAMSHEISHNFGLNHPSDGSKSNCTSSALYDTSIGLNDTTTGAPGPTNCDRTVINSMYQSGGVRYSAPRSAPGGGGGGGAGGTTRQYEQCTEYYWVYYECWGGGCYEQWRQYAGCW